VAKKLNLAPHFICKRFIEKIPHTSQPEVDSTQNISKKQKNEIEEQIFFDFVLLYVSPNSSFTKSNPSSVKYFEQIRFFLCQAKTVNFFFLFTTLSKALTKMPPSVIEKLACFFPKDVKSLVINKGGVFGRAVFTGTFWWKKNNV